jgi:AraC family transcriptional regulator
MFEASEIEGTSDASKYDGRSLKNSEFKKQIEEIMSTKTDQKLELEAPRLVNGKALLIAGLREQTERGAGIPELWQRLMTHKIPNQVGREAYGLNFNTRSGTGNFEYMAGVEVSNASGLPGGFSHVNIPLQTYAAFTHHGHVSTVFETCQKIAEWLPKSDYQCVDSVAGSPDFFERYGQEFNPQTGTGGIEIWVPIK